MLHSNKIKAALLVVVLVFCVFQISVLGRDVSTKFTTLSIAKNDNLQWSMSQVEVEFLQIIVAIDNSEHDPVFENLRELRQRFDVFYSRINTLKESRQFAELRELTGFQMNLERVEAFLQDCSTYIDAEQGVLVEHLPQLNAKALELRSYVRQLALGGINFFPRASDQQRSEISQTLGQLLIATLTLIAALVVALMILLKLYRTSQKVSAENEITRARQGTMVSSSLDAILMADMSGNILEYNGAAEAIFGYTREEVLGRDMVELIIPTHMRRSHRETIEQYLSTGETGALGAGLVKLEGLRKSGEIFPIEMSVSVTKNQSQDVIISFMRDISERLEAETQLRLARDDARAGERAKENLLTVMSHEMRTPLNGVLGTLELMKTTKPTLEQSRYMEAIRISGDMLLHHVNDVLELSRLDAKAIPIESKAIHLKKLLNSTVESQRANAEMKGNTISLKVYPSVPDWVMGDDRRIQQCLLNLLGNAIKFTHGGAIHLDVEQLTRNQEIEFRVCDNGTGIADAELDRIFDEFVTLDASYSRHSEGVGLGLAITRRLVASMRGQIGAESELGEGSLFWFRLPLKTVNLGARAPQAEAKCESAAGLKALSILVVEDNEINRLVLRELLQNAGHFVSEAEDGEAGVHAANDRKFDVILMDISMPGMDGFQAVRQIRGGQGLSSATPIVAVTAHASIDDQHISEAGFSAILTKPISEVELTTCLSNLGLECETSDETHDEDPSLANCVVYFGLEKCREFLVIFQSEYQTFSSKLSSVVSLDKNCRDEAHRLAGSAAVFGFNTLREQLLGIEKITSEVWMDDSANALAELALTWTRVSEEIECFLRDQERIS